MRSAFATMEYALFLVRESGRIRPVFLLWTGNEDALTKLHAMVDRTDGSVFGMDIVHRTPAKDVHERAPDIDRATGRFEFPFTDDEAASPDPIEALCETLSNGCDIRNYFVN